MKTSLIVEDSKSKDKKRICWKCAASTDTDAMLMWIMPQTQHQTNFSLDAFP